MKKILMLSASLIAAPLAQAGGLDRGSVPVSKFNGDEDFIELGWVYIQPSISGDHQGVPESHKTTGNVIPSSLKPYLTYKTNIDENLSMLTSYYNAYGSEVDYQSGVVSGLKVDLNTDALDILANYKINDYVSMYGGVRFLQTQASIDVVYTYNYKAETQSSTQRGYVAGAAFEMKDIALKASLTYQSEIDVVLKGTEEFSGHPLDPTDQLLNKNTDGSIAWIYPQAVTFNFQTGIAKDTLLFAEIKWSEWSKFNVAPDLFGMGTGGQELVNFENDSIDRKLGVGYRLNEKVSLMSGFTYSPRKGSGSAFSPNDGGTGLFLGGSYAVDRFKVSAGMTYVKLNEVQLDNIGGTGVPTTYEGNDAFAYQTSLTYTL